MKSVLEVLQLSTRFLQDRNVDKPRRLVEELLSSLLHCRRMDLYMQFDRPLEEGELSTLREWLKRVIQNEPVQYILGEVDFFGCTIKVDRRALIPRPETELLVEHIAKKVKGQKTLWDVCTGSGCIGISLKKKFPHLEVSLSDISPEAISLARENGVKNGVDVAFYEGDLLAPFQGRKVDIVVSNPPYIATNEFLTLDPSVRDFEPKQALIGGDRGLSFYERLAAEIPEYLNPGGLVFLEIGSAQGKDVQEIFTSPIWACSERIQDWSSKDRFFFLEKQSLSRVIYSLETVQ
jgi:release factor glutamine methyltransferase